MKEEPIYKPEKLKNFTKGKRIEKMEDIMVLCNAKACIVWTLGQHEILRPAAFFQNWQLRLIYKQVQEGNFYYANKINKK